MIRNSFEWFTRWRRWAPRCRGNKRTDVSRGGCRSYYFIIAPGPIRPRVKSPVDDDPANEIPRLFLLARLRRMRVHVGQSETALFPSSDSTEKYYSRPTGNNSRFPADRSHRSNRRGNRRALTVVLLGTRLARETLGFRVGREFFRSMIAMTVGATRHVRRRASRSVRI